jgi:hypothetical protein
LESLEFNTVVPGSGVLFNLVLNAVLWRNVNKMPLTTLSIQNCEIKEKQANALKKVVCSLWWDHDEGYYNDDEGDY